MGNTIKTIESTVKSVKKVKNKYEIYISPSSSDTEYPFLYLKCNHPNFINIFNKLKQKSTHKFTFYFLDIINIEPINQYYTCGIVLGFLDISIERSHLNGYEILIVGSNKKHRLLVDTNQMINIIIGQTYSIYYEKDFGFHFYRVIKYEPCGY